MQDKRTNFSVQDMQQFARKYFDECGRRGMKLKPPAEIRVSILLFRILGFFQLIGENDLEGVMKGAASHGCQFVLVVVADLLVNVHKNLKYWERKYEMVTQQVKVSNMEKIMREGKVMTLENIINKSNCNLLCHCWFIEFQANLAVLIMVLISLLSTGLLSILPIFL